MRRSLSSIVTSTGSASGETSTPAAEVCTRPCDSVTGTRCTRCTPPSNFSSAYGAWPGSTVPLRLHRGRHRLVAAEVRLGRVEDLHAPAAGLGVAGVHPEQVAGEQGRLLPALARLDLEERVLAVGGVARHQEAAEPLAGHLAAGRELVGLLREGGVLRGELAGRLDVVAELEPLLPGATTALSSAYRWLSCLASRWSAWVSGSASRCSISACSWRMPSTASNIGSFSILPSGLDRRQGAGHPHGAGDRRLA